MKPGLRGSGVSLPPQRPVVGLPPRPFLYTLDQISVLLDLKENTLNQRYVYFEGRSIGTRRKDLLAARNIAPDTDKPDWRVAERELVRWMKVKGFKYYERGAVSD